MLRTLHIENFGIVAHSQLEFDPGFNVVTGESGAGKSLIVEAIDAALGARMGTERTRDPGVTTRLRLAFEVSQTALWWQELADWGIDEADGTLVLQREVTEGRSVYRIQGRPVPLAAVRSLAPHLIELTGQHQHQRLLSRDAATRWVDQLGGLGLMREAVSQAWKEWQEARHALAALESEHADADTIQEWQGVLDELDRAQITEGEDEQLSHEAKRLRAGTRLLEGYSAMIALLDGDEGSSGIDASLATLRRRLEAVARDDGGVAALVELLDSAEASIQELRLRLDQWQAGLDLDPARLQSIEERLDLLARLKRRFGGDLGTVMAERDRVAGQMERWANRDWERHRLSQRARDAEAQFEEAAARLSRERGRLCSELQAPLTEMVRRVGMQHAEVEIWVEDGAPGPDGRESLRFGFSANPGQPPKPLDRVASGGEMARVALALTVLEAGEHAIPMVFDEVDTGLGGVSAREVAELLAELSQSRQVIVVSHQPVVAARAQHHWKVEKTVADDRTVSDSYKLDDNARIREIARMLSGHEEGAALAHARDLLHFRVS